MQLYIDPGFRKTIPNVESWFTAYVKIPQVQAALGHVKLCTKAINPGAGDSGKPQQKGGKADKPKAAAKPAKKDDDDDLDLFGDDDDEEGAAAAKAAAEAAKAKKKKEKPPEMSLIIFEVKPVDDTTDLDALA
jgi:hypothetical protein